ncbi:MAG: AI-2E family transporter [Christensenellales bacterium]|jgi:predicted PurR-regulated permease PerM
MSDDRIKKIGTAALALAIVVYAAIRLGPMIRAVFLSVAVAYLLSPLHRALERATPGKRALAVTVLISLLFLFALPAIAAPVLIRDLDDILRQIPALFDRIDAMLSLIEERLSPYMRVRFNGEALQSLGDRVTAFLTNWFGDGKGLLSLSDSLLWVVLVPFISFYILKDRERILRAVRYLIPQKHRTAILSAASSTDRLLRQFLRGQLTISVIVGALTALGLLLAGVRYALLLGILTALCNFIPYIGSIIAAVPIALLSLLGGAGMMVRGLIVMLGVQQIESLILSPRIMGANLGIHPVVILLSVMAGGALGGFMGFLLALPILIVCKGIAQFVQQRWLYKKRTIEDCNFLDE